MTGAVVSRATHDAGLLGLVGRMRVGELARIAEISVEQLVALVMGAAGHVDGAHASGGPLPHAVSTEQALILVELPPATGGRRRRHRRRRVRSVITPKGRFTLPREPPLLDMLGRATLEALDDVVDYWALAVVFHAHDWNLSRSAMRLGTSRRRLRVRWAELRARPRPQWDPAPPGLAERVSPPLSFAGILAGGGTLVELRGASRRWFVASTLAITGENRTHAAVRLGVSRRRVRELRGSTADGPRAGAQLGETRADLPGRP